MAALLRVAAADDGDDAANEHEPRQDDDGQQEDGLRLVGVEENGRLPGLLRADRNLVLLLGEPAHRVEEEVPVALEVETLVGGERGRAEEEEIGRASCRERV